MPRQAGPAGLPPTAYTVLGVLALNNEELSAVEIKSRADRTLTRFYWAPALSHIRQELGRLRSLHLLDERTASLGTRRSTVLYRITEEGERTLRAWVESLPEYEPVVLKHPSILRVWLGANVEPRRLMDILDEHLAQTEQRIDDLLWAKMRTEEVGLGSDQRWLCPRAVQSYMLRYYYAEIANIRQLRDEIESFTPDSHIARLPRKRGALRRRRTAGRALQDDPAI